MPTHPAKCLMARLSTVLFFLLLHHNAVAQGKLMEFSRSGSVDVITREKIEVIKSRNLEEILRFSPQTHHLNSAKIVYDYNEPGVDKNTETIYYDAQNE